MPEVPALFLWKDPSGTSLAMMYHSDYGGIVVVPGADLALDAEVRGDNSGPHTLEEIDRIYARLAARFPKAEIIAANLSEMAQALAPHRDKLPVVTQEIGDTWIYGCPSDPLKVARYRAVARLREDWITKGALQVGDATDIALLRRLLLAPEHTWGADAKSWIDFDNLRPTDLARMLDTKGYKTVTFSWQEKRQDLFEGIAACLRSCARRRRRQSTARLRPSPCSLQTLSRIPPED